MKVLCQLNINMDNQILAWVHLPSAPAPSQANETKIILPVGKDGSTEWVICNSDYFGHPKDPEATYLQVFTKPVMIPRDDAMNLIREIRSTFETLLEPLGT